MLVDCSLHLIGQRSVETIQPYVIGFDVGGTFLKTGLFDDNHTLKDFRLIDVPIHDGYLDPKWLAQVVDKELSRLDQQVDAVGIACPGLLSDGVVRLAVNLGWHGVDIVGYVRRTIQEIPVLLENDVVAAGHAEGALGAGRGLDRFMFVALGTGIGGCLFIDGQPFVGKLGAALNIGHISVDYNGVRCACGNYGCLEGIAGSRAIIESVRQALSKGVKTSLQEMDPNRLTVQLVASAAEEGDAFAAEVFCRVGSVIGHGLASILNLTGPLPVIVGGGLSQAGSLFLEPIETALMQRLPDIFADETRVIQARFPDRAGVIGAALSALKRIERSSQACRL